jgi:hypothetical protein
MRRKALAYGGMEFAESGEVGQGCDFGYVEEAEPAKTGRE